MKDDCARFRRQLELLAEPSGSDLVKRSLAPLVLVYGLGVQAEAPVFWQVYEQALSDLPRMALERAVSEYQRIGKFFPKPAEIRELAEPHAMALRMAAHRAKKASEWQAPKGPTEGERIPSDQYKAMMEDTLGKLAGMDMLGRTKNRQVRPPQARVDETGISAEARALMERRAQDEKRSGHA